MAVASLQSFMLSFITGAMLLVTAGTFEVHAVDKPLRKPVRRTKVRRELVEDVTIHRDVTYATVGKKKLLLDLYVPKIEQGSPPLLVWIHGGGWRNGSKNSCKIISETNRGYAVASINYRLSQEAIFPAQIHDCKGAIRWLRANAKKYGYNSDRIGVGGASAGGHLVALLGTSAQVKELEGTVGGNLDQSSAVQAVCDFYGPTDMLAIAKSGRHGTPFSAESKLLGGIATEKKALAQQASPATFVDKTDAPFLILHGDQDPLVPVEQSTSFEKLLTSAGVEVKLIIIKGAKHGGRQFASEENNQQLRAFFDKHIKRN